MKKTKKSKRIIFICLAALALLLLIFIIAAAIIGSDILGIGKKSREISFTVERGDNTYAVSQNLKEAGVIKYPRIFRYIAKTMGADGKYTYGEYNIDNKMSYRALISKFMEKPDNDFLIKLTIPEGYTSKQVLNLINEKFEGITDEDIESLPNDIYEIKGRKDRNDNYEGYLLPNTYFFYEDASLSYIIETILKAYEEFSEQNDIPKLAENAGMTTDELITLASVVYAESGKEEDMGLISSVFHNRLDIGMKLQSDVTVLYALGVRKSLVTIEDTKTESPYNTYYVKGIPYGPICNPSLAAIKAAANPEESEYLYFCADKDGKVIYSKTYKEHIRAARG